MLMPVELIGLWTFLALLSCAAVCAYVWQRRSDHTPRAHLTVDKLTCLLEVLRLWVGQG